MALTQPYDIVTFAKTSKPIEFEYEATEKPPRKVGNGFETIEVRQSGGFAGVANNYVLHGNGSYEFERSRPKTSGKGKLPKKELAELSSAIRRQDWTKVPDKLLTPGAADLFTYEIKVHSGGKTRQVVCDDLSVGKYPALKAILRALTVIQSGKPQGVPVPRDR